LSRFIDLLPERAARCRTSGLLRSRSSVTPRPGHAQNFESLHDRAQHVDRYREDDRVRLVARNGRQRLQESKLHRLRLARQHLSRFQQLHGGLLFALGMNHFGPARAFGFRLLRNGAHHGFIDIDMLDLDVRDLDTPCVGVGVETLLDIHVELLAFGEHIVEVVLAQYRAERRLRKLARRLVEG
jgi:hypothetical protein